ncbi:NAD(P)H-binding protein [Mucilaginibacter galii]|uniref:Oxidoreductase n=1 Tax=Mucilaginibacter galii TaxID=2005073 RepID=A0A917J839_9SPHI|nr:NAD(P)H-binding protein [Mucilaginibacter galii]GGI50875.1 oxidoreductase [Mucilaginibacter galii]
MGYKAVIAGASGLVGNELLHILLQESTYDEVLILVRKHLPIQHKKLVQLQVSFDELEQHQSAINGHALFCCLGSTKSKTPDLNVYRKIDHDYPVKLAQIALKNKMPHYHLVSAIGANSTSSNFYTKMKGETERDIQAVDIRSLHIYQPSLLTGNRKEHRLTERIATGVMKIIDPLLIGGLKKYQSIAAATVARAMYKQSLNQEEGVFVHPSDHIKQLA